MQRSNGLFQLSRQIVWSWQPDFPAMAKEDVSIRQVSTRWGRLLKIHVALPSGRGEAISILRRGNVVDLKIAVQQALGQPFLRLAAPDGRLLDPTESLRLYGLKDGDSLAAVAQQPKIAATGSAFALWCEGGNRLVTWGDPYNGGDSSQVQAQLQNVQEICWTKWAFAAILADGTVVTWGDPEYGGDSSRVQDQLRNVQQISGTDRAFAAILADGSVVTWGDPDNGGDSSRVQDQLKNVQQICGTNFAFAALLATIHALAVTAPESNISWGMSSRFLPHTEVLLLRFWQMEA